MAEHEPKCPCWSGERREEREGLVNGLGHMIMSSVRNTAELNGLCAESYTYLVGTIMAGIVYTAAFAKHPDEDTMPSEVDILKEMEECVKVAIERLTSGPMKMHTAPIVTETKQ